MTGYRRDLMSLPMWLLQCVRNTPDEPSKIFYECYSICTSYILSLALGIFLYSFGRENSNSLWSSFGAKIQIIRKYLRKFHYLEAISSFSKLGGWNFACGQTVSPDRSVLIGQKLAENAKIQMRHFESFSNNVRLRTSTV